MSVSAKPLLLVVCSSIKGHVSPILAIVKPLIVCGYETTFVTGKSFKQAITSSGATLVPFTGNADWDETEVAARWPARTAIPPGPAQFLHDLEHVFMRSIPDQHKAVQVALEQLRQQHPTRKIIMLVESFCMGPLPTLAGAPGFKPDASLGIGIVPMSLNSIDTAPFGTALPPDSTTAGRARNAALRIEFDATFSSLVDVYQEMYAEVGASVPTKPWIDLPFLLPDRFLQMSLPEFEYPRSDLPQNVGFAGGVPKGSREPMTKEDEPSWWHEIVKKNESTDVIAVTEGTLLRDFKDLVIPTMEALSERPNTILVVVLGQKRRVLPAGIEVSSQFGGSTSEVLVTLQLHQTHSISPNLLKPSSTNTV